MNILNEYPVFDRVSVFRSGYECNENLITKALYIFGTKALSKFDTKALPKFVTKAV
jgi:hypothetical protein